MDFAAARSLMVEGQIRTGDVTDLRLLGAMRELPRERSVHPAQAAAAYADLDVPLPGGPGAAAGRRLPRPRTLAKLLQAADVGPQDVALDVGCTSGYGAAVLTHLAHKVVALEQEPVLAGFAAKALRECGITNASVGTGALTAGWAALAPDDVIVWQGATTVQPRSLLGQRRN